MRKALRGIGKGCIAAAALILLFVAYQLWGTGVTEARAQRHLKTVFNAQPPPRVETAPVVSPPGDAIAILQIPKIHVDSAVVEGVGTSDLQHGPGHYPGSPLPGQAGNAAIAGHRTTYGAPFYDLDQLKAGDEILVTTRYAPQPFEYRVTASFAVDPSDVSVLAPTKDARLTLTTCTPRFTATKRLIVVSELIGSVDTQLAAPPAVAPPSTIPGDAPVSAGLSGKSSSRTPAVAWGLACLAVLGLAWGIARWVPRWAVYSVATPVFLGCLYVFFENFARFVPANL